MSIDLLHSEACARSELSYIDPNTGFRVFTALALEGRGDCCGCACRHCPFGHREVMSEHRPGLRRDPWVEGSVEGEEVDLLFWSGGKDSYLTLRALEREGLRPVVLLTTFDGRSELVAHQELQLDQIREQAQSLSLPQVLVPLYPSLDYVHRIVAGVAVIARRARVARLVFGDLHLDHVRVWREEALVGCDALAETTLHFPLWKVDYETLLADLEMAPAVCRISAVADEACAEVIRVGEVYDRGLVARLPEGADAFGENGEFHTWVQFP